MKRLLALAVIAVAAVVLYTTAAPAGQQAVTPGQFNALKKQVTKLRTDLNAMTTVLAGCVMGNAVPETQYTDYLATDQNNQVFKTTGLDITQQGGTPNGYALFVNSDQACINLINTTSFKRLAASRGLSFHAGGRPTFRTIGRH
jgi:hypothetical protein